MRHFLEAALPRLVSGHQVKKIIIHRGKRDMKRKLAKRLSGLAKSLPETARVFLLLDCDLEDCRKLKADLERHALTAGFRTRSKCPSNWQLVNRIVMRELEAWYFGCWSAVCAAYPNADQNIPSKAKYRTPDAIINPAQAFERVMQSRGYFPKGMSKLDTARCIGERITTQTKITSRSFRVFLGAVRQATQPCPQRSSSP